MVPGCNFCRPEVTQLFLLPLNKQEQILSNRVKATDAINKITRETNQTSIFLLKPIPLARKQQILSCWTFGWLLLGQRVIRLEPTMCPPPIRYSTTKTSTRQVKQQ